MVGGPKVFVRIYFGYQISGTCRLLRQVDSGMIPADITSFESGRSVPDRPITQRTFKSDGQSMITKESVSTSIRR